MVIDSFLFRCPFIWEHIHPAIPIVFAYLFLLSLASMIKTSWTDPGVSWEYNIQGGCHCLLMRSFADHPP